MARLPAAGENAAGNAVLVAGTTYYLSLHSASTSGTYETGAALTSGVTAASITFAIAAAAFSVS